MLSNYLGPNILSEYSSLLSIPLETNHFRLLLSYIDLDKYTENVTNKNELLTTKKIFHAYFSQLGTV